ncbi:MAG: alpha-galactosidase [Acidobacteriota bacterium]
MKPALLLLAPLLAWSAENAWMLENDALAARVEFTPGGALLLTSLSSRSGVRFADAKSPSRLFHFRVRLERQAQGPNGANPPPAYGVLEKKEYDFDGVGPWELLAASAGSREGSHLEVRLGARSEPRLAVTVHLRCRPGAAPLEVWYEVKNTGRWTLFLDRFDSFNWNLAKAPLENATIYSVRKGTTRTNVLQLEAKPMGGYLIKSGPVRDNDVEEFVPWFSIQRPGDAGGVYGGWAFSAFGSILLRPESDAFRITGGLDPAQLSVSVQPGQIRPAPMAFLGPYEGGLDDGANALHRWIERWLAPRSSVALPLVNYNTWTAVGMNVTEQNMLEHVRMAKLLGCELFHIDAGWHPAAAEWEPDPARLPRGLLPIRNAAREAGLKFGLWVAFTQAGRALARKRPEWLTAAMPLNWDPPSYAGLTMCLGYGPAREHMAQVLEKAVSGFQLDYLEHDQSILQTCRRDFHGHSPNAGTYEQTLTYYRLHEDLLRKHPDLLLENCMGGGNILDFGVLQRFHLFSLTDLYDPLGNRQAIYGATFPFPARYGEGYMKEAEGVSYHYQFRSYMMGYWSLSADTTRWPGEKVEACKKDIAAYKRIRSILRDGNVYHILPRPDGWHWDGMEYFDPVTGRGVVFVFRPDSPDRSHTLYLRGLDARASYRVTFEDTPEAFTRTGESLMGEGLRVNLDGRYTSAIAYLNRN